MYAVFRSGILCLLLPALLASKLCAAGWAVVALHPSDAHESWAMAVSGPLQAGSVYDPTESNDTHPAIWHGAAEPYTRIGGPTGGIYALYGSDRVGTTDGRYATLWQGAENTPIALHPAGAYSSSAVGVWSGTQVGYAYWSATDPAESGYRAGLWHGSSGSWTSLHPRAASDSALLAVDSTGQAGRLRSSQSSPYHAALWHGTAESVVDLHPAGAYASAAQAISNGRQGGYVRYTPAPGFTRAAVWAGTADSFLDITPDTTFGAQIYGMDGNVAVGDTLYHGYEVGQGHAIVWTELSKDASFDLHSLLSPDYTNSTAYAVDVDEFGTIRVVGSAYNENYYLPNGTHYPRYEAMMWVLVPEPSSLAALVAGLAGLAAFRRRR